MAGADRQRARLLLGLPAPGQPLPGRDRRRPGLREVAAAEDATGVLRDSATGSTRSPTWRTTPSAGARCSTSGVTHWTWAGPGWSCSTTGAAGCSSPGQPGDAAAGRVVLVPRPGARGLRPPGGRRVAALAAAAGHPPHRGVEREAGGLAPALGGARGGEAAPRPGPGALGGVPAFLRGAGGAFARIGTGTPGSPARGSAPVRRTPHRRRSACSPGTCTTRTWRGPGSPTRRWSPRCTSSPARRSTTRCRPASVR